MRSPSGSEASAICARQTSPAPFAPGSGLDNFKRRVRDETEAELRARLGEDGYAAAYAEGRGLALEDALTLALGPD